MGRYDRLSARANAARRHPRGSSIPKRLICDEERLFGWRIGRARFVVGTENHRFRSRKFYPRGDDWRIGRNIHHARGDRNGHRGSRFRRGAIVVVLRSASVGRERRGARSCPVLTGWGRCVAMNVGRSARANAEGHRPQQREHSKYGPQDHTYLVKSIIRNLKGGSQLLPRLQASVLFPLSRDFRTGVRSARARLRQ